MSQSKVISKKGKKFLRILFLTCHRRPGTTMKNGVISCEEERHFLMYFRGFGAAAPFAGDPLFSASKQSNL